MARTCRFLTGSINPLFKNRRRQHRTIHGHLIPLGIIILAAHSGNPFPASSFHKIFLIKLIAAHITIPVPAAAHHTTVILIFHFSDMTITEQMQLHILMHRPAICLRKIIIKPGTPVDIQIRIFHIDITRRTGLCVRIHIEVGKIICNHIRHPL